MISSRDRNRARDLLQHAIGIAGFRETNWSEDKKDLFSEQELSELMNKILAAFLKQNSCGLLSKFAIIFICQKQPDREKVGYDCCKLWRTIQEYKDGLIEVQMFYNFFNQVYSNEVLEFYFRLRRTFVRQLFGDSAEPTHFIGGAYMQPDKLIAITEKLLYSSGSPSRKSANKGFSDKLSNFMRTLLQTTEVDNLQRIRVVDFLCHCILDISVSQLKEITDCRGREVDLRNEISKSRQSNAKSFLTASECAASGSRGKEKSEASSTEQKIYARRSGSPIQVRQGLTYANNPPPSRNYLYATRVHSYKPYVRKTKVNQGQLNIPFQSTREKSPFLNKMPEPIS